MVNQGQSGDGSLRQGTVLCLHQSGSIRGRFWIRQGLSMNNMYKYFYRIGIILNSIGTLSALLTYIDESFIKEAKLLNPTIKNVVFFLINLSLILFLDIIIPYTLLRKSNSNKPRIKVT